jgi:hypothetical protein
MQNKMLGFLAALTDGNARAKAKAHKMRMHFFISFSSVLQA